MLNMETGARFLSWIGVYWVCRSLLELFNVWNRYNCKLDPCQQWCVQNIGTALFIAICSCTSYK